MTPAAPTIPAPKTINLIAGLIRDYMGLTADQVVIYNQAWKIPPDERLYISVGYLSAQFYGSNTTYEEAADGLNEVSSTQSQESFSINVMSRSQEAVQRKDEVILAFNSTMGQQLCDANSIKLARLPVSFVDISGLEATAMLNRFNVTINVLCARSVSRIVEYFDKYPAPAFVINP